LGAIVASLRARTEVSLAGLRKRRVAGAEALVMPRAALAASVIINILALALPLVVLEVYDSVIPNLAVDSLALLMLGFVGVVIVEAVLRIARSYVAGLGAARFEAAALTEALGHLHAADPVQARGVSDARHLARLTAAGRVAAFYGGQVRWTLVDLPFVVLFLAVMAIIGGPLALAPLLILGLFFALSAASGARLNQALREREEQDSKAYDFITEALSGVGMIKGAAMEPMMERRMERLLGGASSINRRAIAASSDAETLSSFLGNATFVAIAAAGGLMAALGALSIGALAACTLLAGRIVQPVLRAASAWNGLQALKLAEDDLGSFYELGVRDAPETPALRPDPDVLLEDVEVDGLSQPVHLDVSPGEVVVLTGPDARARGALLRILGGELPIRAGLAQFAGAPISDVAQALPGQIVMVPQKSDHLRGTLMENLTGFGYAAPVADVMWAVELLGLRREIERLPLGFETKLGEGPVEALSSGFLQRLALARAVARKPRLLLLEEPQALLDNQSDRRTREGLARLRGQMSVVISTNRPSYAELADQVFIAEGGAFRAPAPPPQAMTA
jgi:ATP-binding cassette subfamily C protein LapB